MSCLVACSGLQRSPAAPRVVATNPLAAADRPAAATGPGRGPVPAPAGGPRLAVIGDFGWAGPSAAGVARLVASWAPDAVLTVGDNNYPDGAASTFDANVAQYYAPFIRFGPAYLGQHRWQQSPSQQFYAALGNHDWRTLGARPLLDALAPPGNGRYFQVSFQQLDVFFVDSDPHEPDGIDRHSPQARWLQGALGASAAATKVVLLHHPPYSSGGHGDHEVLQWPFAAWGADAVIAGHDHHYERLRLGGVTYLVNGAGGAPLRPVTLRPRAGGAEQIAYSAQHGALLLSLSHLGWTAHFITVEGQQVDAVLLTPAGREG